MGFGSPLHWPTSETPHHSGNFRKRRGLCFPPALAEFRDTSVV